MPGVRDANGSGCALPGLARPLACARSVVVVRLTAGLGGPARSCLGFFTLTPLPLPHLYLYLYLDLDLDLDFFFRTPHHTLTVWMWSTHPSAFLPVKAQSLQNKGLSQGPRGFWSASRNVLGYAGARERVGRGG